MTSIYKETVKVLLVLLAITAGIGLSAFSTIKESQASQNSLTNTSVNSDSKRQVYQPKSKYEKKHTESLVC